MSRSVAQGLSLWRASADLPTPGEVSSEDAIPPGSGGVVRHGLSKVAVYRDETGRLFRLSAVCSHLNCIVHWNAAEQSWDCPCHGSRYSRFRKGDQRAGNQGLGTAKMIGGRQPVRGRGWPCSVRNGQPLATSESRMREANRTLSVVYVVCDRGPRGRIAAVVWHAMCNAWSQWGTSTNETGKGALSWACSST